MHSMREQLQRNQRGVSVVEFALLAPIFITLLFGMLAYGQYFYLSRSVQQIANNAARAMIAGADDGGADCDSQSGGDPRGAGAGIADRRAPGIERHR